MIFISACFDGMVCCGVCQNHIEVCSYCTCSIVELILIFSLTEPNIESTTPPATTMATLTTAAAAATTNSVTDGAFTTSPSTMSQNTGVATDQGMGQDTPPEEENATGNSILKRVVGGVVGGVVIALWLVVTICVLIMFLKRSRLKAATTRSNISYHNSIMLHESGQHYTMKLQCYLCCS